MKLRIFAAASAAAMLSIAFAPLAHASTGSPLDCPGVKAVKGGFQATQDFTCTLNWSGSHKFFDLKRHTFTGVVVTDGDHLTLRNGTLVTNGSWLVSPYITLQRMHVESGGTGVADFLIEAGDGFVADHSTFTNISSSVALDFYFGGNNAKVINSTFTGDQIGVSVQSNADVAIRHDRFVGNRVGVNMWDEDFTGVTNVTVADDTFEHNTSAGVYIHGVAENGALDGARIERNIMLGNGGPGLLISLTCISGDVCTPPHQHVIHNVLVGNGTDATATSRSGMYAESLDDSNAPVPGNLANVVVGSNGAFANADLGFDVAGVVDGGHNIAALNGNPAQCVGVSCHVIHVAAPHLAAPELAAPHVAAPRLAAPLDSAATAITQLRHHHH